MIRLEAYLLNRARCLTVHSLLAVFLAAAVPVVMPASVPAQMMGLQAGDDDSPLEIEAEGGIEWQQDKSLVVARGDARARRGDVQVRADTLSAHYRDNSDGGMTVWRLDAIGTVEITAPDQAAYADRGTYDVDEAIMVLSGAQPVRVIGKDGTVTADGQMEYWELEGMLVARGGARAEQGENSIRANVLVAHLNEGGEGSGRIDRIEAFDDVRIDTPDGIVLADYGLYTVATEIATLIGGVRITNGDNQLNGDRAEVNLKTGVSRLFADGDAPVAGFIRPEDATIPEREQLTPDVDRNQR